MTNTPWRSMNRAMLLQARQLQEQRGPTLAPMWVWLKKKTPENNSENQIFYIFLRAFEVTFFEPQPYMAPMVINHVQKLRCESCGFSRHSF